MARTERIGGAALIAAALGGAAAMSHHPAAIHPGSLGGIVHGAMIVAVAATAFGFAVFAQARGAARPAVLAGLVAYALAVFAGCGAATINGFIVPAVVAGGGHAAGDGVLLFAWETNQALARLGVYAAGAAFALWGLDLLADARPSGRLLGWAGLVAGILPPALLAGGLIDMDLAGASLAYAIHGAWTLLAGLWMFFSAARAGSPA